MEQKLGQKTEADGTHGNLSGDGWYHVSHTMFGSNFNGWGQEKLLYKKIKATVLKDVIVSCGYPLNQPGE